MKKRLLALCLAAAMLLGMLPALTLSTNAVETKVTTVSITDFISATNTAVGYGGGTLINNAAYFVFRQDCTDHWTIASSHDSRVLFDHTKEILFEQYYLIYTAGNHEDTQGNLSYNAETGGFGATSCFYVTLKDAETGNFLYYYITGGAGTTGTEYQVGFLKPDGTNVYVPLGLDGSANVNCRLGLRWKLDGSVEVLAGGVSMGTVADVTWTADPNAAVDSATNPAAWLDVSTKVTDQDYVEYRSTGWNQVYIYDYTAGSSDTAITHTEYLPAKMDSYFTDEALAADGALTESSWSAANFEEVADGLQAAVLVNKGVAYVALKGTNGTYNVQLGTITKSVEVKNGVGEVEIGNVGLTAYGETRDLTVGTAKATVTFAAKKTNTTPVTTEVDLFNNYTIGSGYTTAYSPNYISFKTGGFTYYETKAGYADLGLDRSSDVTVNVDIGFQEGFFATSRSTLSGAGSARRTWNGNAENYLMYTLHDSATNTHFIAYFTADENADVYLCIYQNDQSTVEVKVGNNADADGKITETIRLDDLQFVWKTDDSVTVMLDGAEILNAPKATWETNTSHNNYIDNPGASTTAGNDYYQWWASVKNNSSTRYAYLRNMSFTNTPATVDITTSVAEDLAAKVEAALGDLNDVAALPQAVEHDALGTVALTWSDTADLVSNNVLTIPSEDTVTTLTAMSGTTEIWSGEVTVKAADPIVGVFTPEDLTSGDESWSLVPFTQLFNSTDSVAVLATDTNNVYVAVKSADSSATVTLNGNEQPVAIVDGMGVVKFENVGLSAYGDARTIKVTTSTGSLDTKVLFNATEVKLPYTNTVTVDLFDTTTKNFAGLSTNPTITSPHYIAFRSGNFTYYETKASYADLGLDRSSDVIVNVDIGFQETFFATTLATLSGDVGAARSWDNNNYLMFNLHDSATMTHFLSYFTADENADVYLCIYQNDKSTVKVKVGNNADADGKITETIHLDDLQFVWKTDGSITVMLGGEEILEAPNATWSTDATKKNNLSNPIAQGYANNDYYQWWNGAGTGSSKYAYVRNISFSNPVEGSVQDIVKAKVENYNVTLKSDVAMNFLMNDVAGAALKVVHNGETYTYYTDELSANDAGYLTARLDLAAAQMADDISVTVIDAYGMTTEPVTTSVEDYAAVALAAATDDNVKNMINAMLNYGAAAKAYFNYQIDNAMGAVTAPALGTLTDLDAAAYNHSVEGAIEGITATSATLRLEEQVKIRFYFSGDITAYEVTGGEAVYENGRSYVDVAVAPKSIDEMKTVTVSDGTNTLSVTYGCMTYLTRHADDAALGDLMQAIYTYSLAAEAYPA